MARQKFDTGFSDNPGRLVRMINKDGSFNIVKIGTQFSAKDLFQYLIKLNWFRFNLLVIAYFFITNFLFALTYWSFNCNINGIAKGNIELLDYFFFSVQTFTTVGYGSLSPGDNLSNFIASFEALTGLMSFALATGLLYGKFSKPKARIRFTENAIICPFENEQALMFRIANERTNVLTNMNARVIASYFSRDTNKRMFQELDLQINDILYFPLNWTIVHPITEESPLNALSLKEMKEMNFEFLITIKGFDDTYNTDVQVQSSYTADELIRANKYLPTYHYNQEGRVIMDLDKLDDYEKASIQSW